METHENIKTLRERMGLSQEALAEKTGYKDRSSIAKIEAGLVDLSQSKIAAFAKALNVTPGRLMGIEDERQPLPPNIVSTPKMYEVPLVGTIACGQPVLAIEEADEYVQVPEYVRADFALRCKGESMIEARINDGDIVYIRRQPEVENGQIAAVRIGNEATLKKVRVYQDMVILEAANQKFEPLVYRGEELNEIEVLGKAVAFTSAITYK